MKTHSSKAVFLKLYLSHIFPHYFPTFSLITSSWGIHANESWDKIMAPSCSSIWETISSPLPTFSLPSPPLSSLSPPFLSFSFQSFSPFLSLFLYLSFTNYFIFINKESVCWHWWGMKTIPLKWYFSEWTSKMIFTCINHAKRGPDISDMQYILATLSL